MMKNKIEHSFRNIILEWNERREDYKYLSIFL